MPPTKRPVYAIWVRHSIQSVGNAMMARKLSQASTTKILWVEGRWTSNPEFVPSLLQKGFQVERVASGKEALESVGESKHDLVIVDAASMRTNGKRICSSIRDKVNGLPILVISDKQHP